MVNTRRTLTITTQMLLITMLVGMPALCTFWLLLKASIAVHLVDYILTVFTTIDFIKTCKFYDIVYVFCFLYKGRWKVYLWSIWGGVEIWRFASSSLLILLLSGDISSIISVKKYWKIQFCFTHSCWIQSNRLQLELAQVSPSPDHLQITTFLSISRQHT